VVRYLEELLDDEGRLDGCDAAGRDEEDVCVSFAPVACCGKVRWHVSSYLASSRSTLGCIRAYPDIPDRTNFHPLTHRSKLR